MISSYASSWILNPDPVESHPFPPAPAGAVGRPSARAGAEEAGGIRAARDGRVAHLFCDGQRRPAVLCRPVDLRALSSRAVPRRRCPSGRRRAAAYSRPSSPYRSPRLYLTGSRAASTWPQAGDVQRRTTVAPRPIDVRVVVQQQSRHVDVYGRSGRRSIAASAVLVRLAHWRPCPAPAAPADVAAHAGGVQRRPAVLVRLAHARAFVQHQRATPTWPSGRRRAAASSTTRSLAQLTSPPLSNDCRTSSIWPFLHALNSA